MSIKSTFVTVNGVRTRYLHSGTAGSPVLLLHGAGTDSATLSWQLAIEALSSRHRVIAPDLPGYGETDCPDVTFSNSYYVAFATDFLRALDISRANIVGLSLGGAVALELCLSVPRLVEKLVLVSAFGIQSHVPLHKLSYLLVRTPGLTALAWAMLRRGPSVVRSNMRKVVHNPDALSDDLINEILRDARKPTAGRAFHSYQKSSIRWGGVTTYFVPRLHEIAVPTLIVHGADDALVPVACAQQAHALIAGSQLHVMAGCGHWPQRENAADFNQCVRTFLDGIPVAHAAAGAV